MTSDRHSAGLAGASSESLDAAFARVLAAERAAEEAVLACQAEADALQGEAEREAQQLAEHVSTRRRQWSRRRAEALAHELAELQQQAAAAAGPVALNAAAGTRLANAVAQLAAELCGEGTG